MTGKTKNILAVIGFFVLLVVCYAFGISDTLEQKQKHDALKQQQLVFENAPKQFSVLKQKQIHYDSLLTKYQLGGSSIQNSLLKTITGYANDNDLKVIQFLEPHVFEKNSLKAKTFSFTLEGRYNECLGLIHHLEQNTRFGEIINLHFEKKKNFRTGRSYLQCKVLLRSYEE